MEIQHTDIEKRDRLATDVLRLSRNTLLVNLRFLDMALSQFQLIINEDTTLMTDGKYLLYHPSHVLKSYRAERELPVRDYLHLVLHCVYRHMFVNPALEHDMWDLSCDIAVENVISELGLKCACAKRESRQSSVLAELKNEVNLLTAEKIYAYLRDKDLTLDERDELYQLFRVDDHRIWYMTVEKRLQIIGTLQILDEASDGTADNQGADSSTSLRLDERSVIAQAWKDISERMQEDLETFSKKQGTQAGSMIQNLAAVNREKYDYTAFLRKFAVPGEAMKINDEEFDYIFYTYGLKLYGNMPLIEPLEYKEVKRIREFVIAIDTSGSTSGELVQKFVQKTYNILKSTESFFSKINLHIIQCDAAIQEHVKISSQEEFDDYLKNMQIHGLGGTDFRPVFNEVDELVQAGEFSNLKGLIYFTDGYGDFPAKKPNYQTAFVFIDDEYNNPEVPSWAIKLVLQKDEI